MSDQFNSRSRHILDQKPKVRSGERRTWPYNAAESPPATPPDPDTWLIKPLSADKFGLVWSTIIIPALKQKDLREGALVFSRWEQELQAFWVSQQVTASRNPHCPIVPTRHGRPLIMAHPLRAYVMSNPEITSLHTSLSPHFVWLDV